MNYKRLTNNNRNEYDPEYDFCGDCKYFGEPCGCNRPNGTCDNYDSFLEIYNRLAKLEDKIENGTLVELPRNKIKIRDDKEADWNSQNFPKGSGGPYDYGYTEEELSRKLINIEIQNMIRSLSIPGDYYSLHKSRQKR